MKLSVSVSEINLFSGLARSVPGMAAAAVISSASVLAWCTWLAGYLEERSDHVGKNLGLLALTFVGMALAGWFVAMLVCSLIFGRTWRLTVLAGEHVDARDDDVPIGDNSIAFFAVFLAASAALYFAGSAITDNFVSRYNRGGFYVTRLRNVDPAERVAALRALNDPVYESATAYGPLRIKISDAIVDPDPSVRPWAAWIAGEREIREAQPNLISLLMGGTSEERAEAAIALGRLGDPDAERRLIALLPTVANDPELSRAYLTALGTMGSTRAIPTYIGLIGVYPPELEVVLMWAIKKSDHTDPHDAVLKRFLEADSVLLQCAAADALQRVAIVDDDAMLRQLFLDTPPGFICPEVAVEGRRYRDESKGTITRYMESGDIRYKYLTAIANVRGFKLREWLVEIAWSETEPDEFKIWADQVAEALLRAPAEPQRTRMKSATAE